MLEILKVDINRFMIGSAMSLRQDVSVEEYENKRSDTKRSILYLETR